MILIFLFGLFLRAYNFNNNTEYLSSDSVVHAFFAFNFLNFKSLFVLNPKGNAIAALFYFPYGFFQFGLIAILFVILSVFKIALLESYVFLLLAFMGSLVIIGVYLIVKELACDKILGILAALYVCIEPNLLSQSRIAGMSILTSLSVEVFVIYFSIMYFKYKKTSDAWLSSLFLGIFFCACNMAILIIPLILFIGYIYNRNIKELLKLVFRKETLVFPAAIIGIYFAAFIYSYIYHFDISSNMIGKLITKTKVFGFYGTDLMRYYIENCGFVLFLFFLIGIFYGIYKTIKLSPKSIIFVWGFIFTYPFLFFTPPYATAVRAFLTESQLAWGLLGIMALYEFYRNSQGDKKHLYAGIIAALYLFIFIFSCGFVYNLKYYSGFSFGSKKYMDIKELGVKAAGFYIRENIQQEKKIFTDLEPILSQYYFGKELIYCQYDSTAADNLKYLKEIGGKIDVVAISADDELLYREALKKYKFYKIAVIKTDNKPIRYIYSKEKQKEIYLDKKYLDDLFNKKYANIKNIMPYKIHVFAKNRPMPE